MTTISATTILRSRHSQRPDKILSTLLLRYPRFIHAEMMTHRQFSRNAASSRAIPIKKLIRDVMDNPAIPIHWGKNQPGMQAHEECDAPIHIGGDIILTADDDTWMERRNAWLTARDCAVHIASAYADAGYHKQIANRLLEPFAHITVLVSATEWSNFLALRDHPDAEPHIAMLAREIRRELNREDNIQTLLPGQWHLPFVEPEDRKMVTDYLRKGKDPLFVPHNGQVLELYQKLSLARCASTSYKTVDGFDMTIKKAIEIADKLVGSTPLHASPAEHVAQVDSWDDAKPYIAPGWRNIVEHGNFEGFRQFRKMLPNECL